MPQILSCDTDTYFGGGRESWRRRLSNDKENMTLRDEPIVASSFPILVNLLVSHTNFNSTIFVSSIQIVYGQTWFFYLSTRRK